MEVGACFHNNEYGHGPRCTPTVDGDFLYALGSHGELVCVDTASGKKVWSQGLIKNLGGKAMPFGYCESPLVDSDLLIVTPGGKKGGIVALNKKTGTLQWCCPIPKIITYASILAIEVGGVRQYIQRTFSNNVVVGVRASDGKLLWQCKTGLGHATPIYHNGCVYVPSHQGKTLLFKLTAESDTCKVESVYADEGALHNSHSGVVRVGSYVYGYSYLPAGWMCQDLKTGKEVWRNPNLGDGSLTFADGNLYCHQENGDVLLLKASPAGYQEKGKFHIPEKSEFKKRKFTAPVVANGKLYIRHHELIFCYDIHKSQRRPRVR